MIGFRTKWIQINGYEFKPGEVIVHKITEDDDPEVAIISNIYVVNNDILLFKARCFRISDYLHHYRAYVITPLHRENFFLYEKLPLYLPLHPRVCRAVPHSTIIIMPFCVDFSVC